MLASGYFSRSEAPSSGSFFKRLLAGLVALFMLRAWHAGASAQPLQVIPAPARVDWSSQPLSHPGRDFGNEASFLSRLFLAWQRWALRVERIGDMVVPV